MAEETSEGTLLWTPSPRTIEQANITKLMYWLSAHRNLTFTTYAQLWQWSVQEIEQFWDALWGFCDIKASQRGETVLVERTMPGAIWFPEARLNYAENIFAQMSDDRPALLFADEETPFSSISWRELYVKTAVFQQTLKAMGVGEGDRVAACLPNIPEAIIACLATISLGAIWSSASPDFGAKAIIDRFSQIEPKVLLVVDGYRYNGKAFDRRQTMQELQNNLSGVTQTITVSLLGQTVEGTVLWNDLVKDTAVSPTITFEQLSFDHPLWVLYSSGTTGLPKPIVHGHGGNLLEHKKALTLHNDLKPGDRFFWYTNTGWMMWNYLLGSLLTGSTAVLYNGSPAYPNLDRLWDLAERTEMTYFGLSPAFIAACIKADIHPNQKQDLSRLRGIGSTGAPLPAHAFHWIYENVHDDLALESLSGGTDLCTAFVGGARILPVYAGEIQGASLGAKVQAFNNRGQPVIGEVGELVITEPMPSMPIKFWNDPEMKRYRASYFEEYPNVWRHGDWILFNERGGCIIYGRSDATINRKGIRMGTSEFYTCVEALDEVLDSLVVDLEMLGHESFLPLFVVLRDRIVLDDALKQKINNKLRIELSPRHVPDEIYQVSDLPYTLSGKKLEIPVRRILLGEEVTKAANLGAMRNPDSIAFFVDLAAQLNQC